MCSVIVSHYRGHLKTRAKMQTRVVAFCSLVCVLLHSWMIIASAQITKCPLLDSSGCCGLACQTATCRALFFVGNTLGAAPISAPTWRNTGWSEVLQDPGVGGYAACQQYMATAAGTANSSPGYCSWYGITCNNTAHSSTCNRPGSTYAVSEISLIEDDLSGDISTPGFVESLKELHDCGMTRFIIGGSSYEVRGQISALFGQMDRLRTLGIFTTNITGTLPRELGNMLALEELYLQGNYLYGTLPEQLGNLMNLRVINLAKNGFTDVGLAMYGPLPKSFERLRKLEVLSLEANAFSGTLPPSMCTNMTSLNAVGLRDNNFKGSAEMLGQCGLVSLDLANNYFTGSLPVPASGSGAWQNLTVMRLSNNLFTGALPDIDFGEVPILSHVSVANNSLTGAIPVSWTWAPWLSTLDISFNSITGTVHREFAFLARLTSLLMNNNPNLTGTISPWFRLAVSLEKLHLQNTDINGTLPGITRAQWQSGVVAPGKLCGSDAAGLGRIPNLQSVTMLATEMAAACGENNELTSIDQALPWYLDVDNHTWQVPLADPDFASNTGIECPRIRQTQYCNLNQPPQDFPADQQPVWFISPSYYHYLGCRCLSNYERSWSWRSIDGTPGGCQIKTLTCSPETGLDPQAIFGVSFSLGVLGVVLLAYCLYVSWYGRWGLPKLKRAYDDIKKRREGAPKSGKVSFVVTDIEGYSALIVAMPLVMGRAISHHNNVMRRAAWTHYGFTVGQEGDSYLLAFREALDAVAFCLQVQQALMKVDWPQELLQHQQQQDAHAAGLNTQPPNDPSNHSHNGSGSYSANVVGQPRRSHSGASQGLGHSANAVCAAARNVLSASPVSISLRQRISRPSGLLLSSSKDEQAGSSGPSQPPLAAAAAAAAAGGGLVAANGAADGENGSSVVQAAESCSSTAVGSTTPGSTLWQQGPVRSVSFSDQVPVQNNWSDSASLRARTAGSDVFARLASAVQGSQSAAAAAVQGSPSAAAAAESSKPAVAAAISAMVPGLRVRMGVASGVMSDKEDCLSSKVLEVARVVSDAGSGGQVLMCSSTFTQVKDRLEELGQVGASGYSSSSRVTGWGTPNGWLARRLRKRIQLTTEAFVLDMGLYSIPGFIGSHPADTAKLLADVPRAAAAAAAAAQDGQTTPPAAAAAGSPAVAGTAAAATGGAAVAPSAAATAADKTAQTPAAAAAAAAEAGGVAQQGMHLTTPTRLGQVVEGVPGVVPTAAEAGSQAPAVTRAAAVITTPTAAAATGVGAARPSGCLRLYQVLAPRLLDRAHIYGNKLQLKSGTTLHDLPYFCAPAAANRSLLDQLLSQSPALTGLWKHGSGSVSGRQPMSNVIPSSRVLSGVSDSQQQQQQFGSPVTSSSGGILSLWQQQQQAEGASSHYGGSSRGSRGRLFRRRSGGSTAQQQQHWAPAAAAAVYPPDSAAAAAAANRAAAAEVGMKDEQLSPSPAAGSGSSSVWLLPRLPLQQQSKGAAAAGTAAADASVTFVFCSVVLPNKAWITLEPSVAHQVANIVSSVLRQCLLALANHNSTAAAAAAASAAAAADSAVHLGGGSTAVKACGYMCREVAADMKYLLVFHSPRLALEWCLLVQETLLWQDWPPAVLEKGSKTDPYTAFSRPAASKDVTADADAAAAAAAVPQQQQQPVRIEGSSHPLFRGPRIKMGVACGAPQTVCPDHMGRADYHGNSINMAARYEAVCSQGGQVVCDAALAAAVVTEWTEIAAAAATAAAAASLEVKAGAAAAAELQASASETADEAALLQWQQQQQQLTAQLSAINSGSPFAAAEEQQQEKEVAAVQPLLSPAATGTSSLAFTIDELSFSSSPTVAAGPTAAAVDMGLAAAAVAQEPAADDQGGLVAESIANGLPTIKQQRQQQLVRKGSNGGGSNGSSSFRLWKYSGGKGKEALPSRRASSSVVIELPTIDSGSAAAATTGDAAAAAVALSPRAVSADATMPHGWGPAAAARPSSAPEVAGISPRQSFQGQSPHSTIAIQSAPVPSIIAPTPPGRRGAASVRHLLRGAAAAATPAVVHMEPTPTQLPCTCCVSELPTESFNVEVHQIGKFTVKGQSGPVDMVEVLFSHLAGRRALLTDAPPKSAKGRLLEPQSDKCAVVPAVELPAVALQYMQQYEQRAAAAAAATAAQLGHSSVRRSLTPSRSQTMASLRQNSLPVTLLVTRTLSSFSGGGSASSAAAAWGSTTASAGGVPASAAVVSPGPQGSWMRRAFSLSSGSSGSGGSSPRASLRQQQQISQLGLNYSITESADEEQV